MYENEFIIVLPSNSSMDFFPNNTTTNYSTRLPREVELRGKWLVGLSEIHIPCSTLHLQREDTKISHENDIDDFFFPHGTYNSIKDLLHVINEALFKYHGNNVHEQLFYDEKGGYVTHKMYTKKTKISASLSEPVKRILGFEDGGYQVHDDDDAIGEELLSIIVAKHPASLSRAVPDQLFVYTNLCEPCIVGDTHAPLLRIVNLEAKKYNYGTTTVKRFAPINYIPLLTNRFQTIDIDIRDQFGKPVAFEFGTLTITLQFRRDY